MITKLLGRIEDNGASGITLLTQGGVGYGLLCSTRSLAAFSASEHATVFVETVMSQEKIQLYGFATESERAAFRLLTTVQGVGGRVGLALLSLATPDDLWRAIAAGDKAFLTQADGVGAKLALRLTTELKDKVGSLALGQSGTTATLAAPLADKTMTDALAALESLGYTRGDATAALRRVMGRHADKPNLSLLVKECLQEIAA